eukprot:COSAG02_NODE_6651_length_3435_cov_5.250899_3_plen_63_part_00
MHLKTSGLLLGRAPWRVRRLDSVREREDASARAPPELCGRVGVRGAVAAGHARLRSTRSELH